MPKVGRNDPCPCGSGKKYKHCHLRIDRELERQRVELERAWRTLPPRLLDFAQGERFAADGVAAWKLWWDNKVPIQIAGNLEDVERLRFLDWFTLNFRTSRDRKRIAELFVDEFHDELSDRERSLVRDWADTYLSVYAVVESTPEELHLEDVFTGETRQVGNAADLGPIPTGVLLLGRLLPLGSEFRLAPGAVPLPGEERDALLEFLTPRFEAWQQARYGADWHDFLREAGYQLNHFLIRDMEPIEVPQPQVGEMPPEEAALSIARRMQSKVIAGPLDLHYERWLDEPIPEWGDRTPREMAQTPEGREYLEPLLAILEETEQERARSGQPSYDIESLRRKLGLSGERRTEAGIIVP